MYDDDRARVGHNATDFAAYGLSDLASTLPKSNSTNKTPTNPLADHAAVTGYRGVGVSTEDLTSFIEAFASLRANRVKGVGHSQYAIAQGQKFESFTTVASGNCSITDVCFCLGGAACGTGLVLVFLAIYQYVSQM